MTEPGRETPNSSELWPELPWNDKADDFAEVVGKSSGWGREVYSRTIVIQPLLGSHESEHGIEGLYVAISGAPPRGRVIVTNYSTLYPVVYCEMAKGGFRKLRDKQAKVVVDFLRDYREHLEDWDRPYVVKPEESLKPVTSSAASSSAASEPAEKGGQVGGKEVVEESESGCDVEVGAGPTKPEGLGHSSSTVSGGEGQGDESAPGHASEGRSTDVEEGQDDPSW